MKMKINSKDFRLREAHEVDLRKWPTNVEPVYKSKEQYHKLLADHVAQLSSLQQLLYASNRYAALLIFQAMDAAGKDGAIKHVMSGVSATSTRDAPWYVVPADDKENARLIVSQIVLDTFEALKMTYPKTTAKRRQELQVMRKRLAK
jgi:polyphosphate kinase 2 (PPK2 family)